MPDSPDRTALMELYTTSEAVGLAPYLNQLYPQFLQARLYMSTAESCPNGGPGIWYGHWDSDDIERVRVVEWGAPLTPAPVAVYRLRNQSKRLLYVGITDDLDSRWASHAATKAWWPNVAIRSVEWYANRAHALAAEAQAIRAEKPLYNIQHNDKLRTKLPQ